MSRLPSLLNTGRTLVPGAYVRRTLFGRFGLSFSAVQNGYRMPVDSTEMVEKTEAGENSICRKSLFRTSVADLGFSSISIQ